MRDDETLAIGFSNVNQQVFWLSDRPVCRAFPPEFPGSGRPLRAALRHPSPITAAGPPRNCTVFLDADVGADFRRPAKMRQVAQFGR